MMMCPNCKEDMGWNAHGVCEKCGQYCGCSFNPTSSNDFCSDHNPWKDEPAPTPEFMSTRTRLRNDIDREIYLAMSKLAMSKLGAEPELLAIIGSLGIR